jgi:hypothetical protein
MLRTLVSGVSPSLATDRLLFESFGPGSGACYLTCHGRDHAPEAYGSAAEMLRRVAPHVMTDTSGAESRRRGVRVRPRR